MNIFVALLAGLLGQKKKEKQSSTPDYSERMARVDMASNLRRPDQRLGKSQGAPSQRMSDSGRRVEDPIMSNPLHPLNPISPISIYSDPTPSSYSSSNCSSSSNSSYDSGSSSSSSDSGSSSCSSD